MVVVFGLGCEFLAPKPEAGGAPRPYDSASIGQKPSHTSNRPMLAMIPSHSASLSVAILALVQTVVA